MTIVFVLVGLAMIVSAVLAVYAGWRRSTPGAGPFALLMFAIAWWCWGVLLGISSLDLETKLFWAKMVFFSIVTVPVAWVVFVLEYTGHVEWLSRRNLILLSIIPVMTLGLAWTTETHGLIYASSRLDLSSGYPMVQTTFGPWSWGFGLYCYVLILIGILLLIWTTLRLPAIYRRQATILLIGSFIPLISNFVSLSGLNPFPALDFTPLAFALSGIIFAWGLFRLGLLDLVPVARDLVIDQMSDGLMVLDARDRILDANPALQRVSGLPMAQIIGKSAEAILPEWKQIAQVDQTAPIRRQMSRVTPAGQHEYTVRIAPLLDQRGRLTGRVVTLHDVTDWKQTETALQQAKQVAEASERAKSNFLATVSYELRTPLATIASYSRSMLSEIDRGNSKLMMRYLERINTASQHLLAIVNRLIDLTKIELKTMPLPLKVFDLIGVVREVVESAQPMADANKNTLSLNAPAAIAMYANKDKVAQIILALLDNACKFTRNGQITVAVQRVSDEAYEGVVLTVQDTGQGISPEHLPHLFEPFTQANQSLVREFGSTGLSLALSQRLCEMMNGTIEATSLLNRGSTFTVRLPVNAAEPQAQAALVDTDL